MDLSFRLKLIEKLLECMTADTSSAFAVKDLILNEFKFGGHLNPDFSTEEEYFLDRLNTGNDEQILRIAEYYNFLNHSIEVDDSMWEQGKFRVFLSFISQDGHWAKHLKDELMLAGITGFLSHVDINPNEHWENVIENALSSCEALVALLTENYHDSDWTDQEIGWAYGRRIPVIPIRAGLDPYGFVGKIQAIRHEYPLSPISGLFSSISPLTKKIINVLWDDERCHPSLDRAMVHALANSNSWDTTRFLFSYIERMKKEQCSDEMISLLTDASRSNINIFDARTVPYREGPPLFPQVEALLERLQPHQPSFTVDDLPFE